MLFKPFHAAKVPSKSANSLKSRGQRHPCQGERRGFKSLRPLKKAERCLDHVIVLNERDLRRILTAYFAYYHRSRTHLSLGKDAPEPRAVQPPSMGQIVELPEVGGLHHRYERRAA